MPGGAQFMFRASAVVGPTSLPTDAVFVDCEIVAPTGILDAQKRHGRLPFMSMGAGAAMAGGGDQVRDFMRYGACEECRLMCARDRQIEP